MDTRNLKSDFYEYESNIVEGFQKIFGEKDKEVITKMMKHIYKNMKSELGFAFSIYSLPWCKLSHLSYEEKDRIFKELSNMIEKNGIECAECKTTNKTHSDNITIYERR